MTAIQRSHSRQVRQSKGEKFPRRRLLTRSGPLVTLECARCGHFYDADMITALCPPCAIAAAKAGFVARDQLSEASGS